ncbi:MAG: hypothetical protein ACI4EU_01800 [Butyrivibrio sp.]
MTTTNENQSSDTMKALIAGIIIYFLIVSVPVLIFTKDRLKGELGLLAGVLIALGMAVHMNYVTNKLMYMESGHTAFAAWNSAGRLLLAGALLLLIGFTGWLDVITAVIGLFALKISAYLQPLLIKFFSKENKQKRR